MCHCSNAVKDNFVSNVPSLVLWLKKLVKMHRMSSVKIMNAQQGSIGHNCKNTKELSLNNAAIWFNKMCRMKHLTP